MPHRRRRNILPVDDTKLAKTTSGWVDIKTVYLLGGASLVLYMTNKAPTLAYIGLGASILLYMNASGFI